MKYKNLLRVCIMLLAFIIFPLWAASAGLKGVVNIDLNKNNQENVGEKGMEGVSVSDRLIVVLTDGSGNYRLPGKQKTRFIQLADTEAGDDFEWVGPIRDYAANEDVSFDGDSRIPLTWRMEGSLQK